VQRLELELVQPAASWTPWRWNPAVVVQPGEETRWRTRAYRDDGSSLDVTDTVSWELSDGSGRRGSVRNGILAPLDVGEWTLGARHEGGAAAYAYLLVMPAGTFALKGGVLMAGTRTPVRDASVGMVGGQHAGQRVTTSWDGEYWLMAIPSGAEIEVTHHDFRPARQKILLADHSSRLDFMLTEGPSLMRIDGRYTLTVAADPACSTTWWEQTLEPIPDDLRVRRYDARVLQVANSLTVEMKSESFLGNLALFLGTLRPGFADFSLYYSPWDYPPAALAERIGPSKYLIIEGAVTISTTSLSGTLDGSLFVVDCPYGICDRAVAACRSSRHLFTLAR
jgi:hypothetical protein